MHWPWGLIFFYTTNSQKNKHHWNEEGVVNTGCRFFWGNDKEFLLSRKSVHQIPKEEYFKFSEERFYGGWTVLRQPYLMLRNDFDLIRAVWLKDFDHFNIAKRGDLMKNVWPSSREEKLGISHVGNVNGEVWKDLRYLMFKY